MKVSTYEAARSVYADSLKCDEHDVKPRAIQPTVIVFDGHVVMLKSGKCVWRKPGDAKAALRNHLYYEVYPDYDSGKYVNRNEWVTKFIEEMTANGRLKFQPQSSATNALESR